MENFVLYEELGRGDNSIVYKGRRKGTINFLAIQCIDKIRRHEVTNTVRMTYDLSHTNVVQFHEWYETSNHLWLVVELCTGGTLETVIKQDGHLPESSICGFAVDVVTGLNYLHSLAILFSDFNPNKFLLDGSGAVKLADFGLSRCEGENLFELFQKFVERYESDIVSDGEHSGRELSTEGSLLYTAPEVIQGGEHTPLSDLWGLGCLLYQMFAGHPPFEADTLLELKTMITTQNLPTPRVKGSRLCSKPSPEFLSLLSGLIEKDPAKRFHWPALLTHPFWKGKLATLAANQAAAQAEVTSQSMTMITAQSSSTTQAEDSDAINSSRSVDWRSASQLDTSAAECSRPGSVIGEHLRPKTAPGHEDGESLFTLSGRPHSIVPPDDKLAMPSYPSHQMQVARIEQIDGMNDHSSVQNLIYHPSDFIITPIVDNPKIVKAAPLKYESKTLPVPPYSVDKLLSMSDMERQKHLSLVIEQISITEKGPPSQKRCNLVQYATVLAGNAELTAGLVATGVLVNLGKQVQQTLPVDFRIKLCRLLAIIAHHAQDLPSDTELTEVFSALAEGIRDHGRNGKLKQGLLPALGELLYLVARQDKQTGQDSQPFTVPSLVYTMLLRCCRDTDDGVLCHMAAKVIENVTTVSSPHCQKLLTLDVAQALWGVFKISGQDAAKITALSALCRITHQSPSLFQNLIDSVGVSPILSALSLGVNRIQQSVVTMFGALLTSGGHSSRLTQDKNVLPKLMRLLESPSPILRGKTLLVLCELSQAGSDILGLACQNRLVMYMERDSRQVTPGRGDLHGQEQDYLYRCLSCLLEQMVTMAPVVLDEVVNCLVAVHGRKHPSTSQAKQLRVWLPRLSLLLHLVTSQLFRCRIVTGDLMQNLGQLLQLVRSIETKETNIELTVGAMAVTEFVSTALSIVESISQHASLLTSHRDVVLTAMLPAIGDLLCSQSVDIKVLSVRVFAEAVTVFLAGSEELTEAQLSLLHQHITDILLPRFESLMLDVDPLPSCALRLMLGVLEIWPVAINTMERLDLTPVLFQLLLDYQNKPVTSIVHSIMGIIGCIIRYKESNMEDLYEQGLIDHLYNALVDTMVVFNDSTEKRPSGLTGILQVILEAVSSLLKYVSDVVRHALQAKKLGGGHGRTERDRAIIDEADRAEQLLLQTKPLTELISNFTQMICHEDPDVQETAVRVLSLTVQLFGGDGTEALTEQNMVWYSQALRSADSKRQKVLLRIIKRLLITDRKHIESLYSQGQKLADTIKTLAQTASSQADMGVSSLAVDILKAAGHWR